MPALQTRNRRQKAVYWAANSNDKFGEVKVDAAIEIKVRWEKDHNEVLDPKGASIVTEATVVVDREIIIGSILWLGALADLPALVADYEDLKQAIVYNETPDIKNIARKTRRTVKLMKYSNQLPALA